MRRWMIELLWPVLILLGLNAVHCVINAKRQNRRRQIVMPLLSLIYSVVIIVVFYQKYEQFRQFMEQLQEYAALAQVPFLQGFRDLPVWRNIESFRPLVWDPEFYLRLLGGKVQAIMPLVINIGIYGLYIFGRIIPNVILCAVNKAHPLFKDVLEKFYRYDEESGQWLLYNKWTNVRELLKILRYVMVVMTGMLLGFMKLSGGDSVYNAMVLPCIALLVITEFYIFFNGITEFEYEKSVTGDDIYANKIRNLYVLREIYEKVFAHELLTSETKCDYTSMKSVTDYLEELEGSEIETDQKIAEFFRLNGEVPSYDADYISATRKLLHGENVVFFDPFYRDMGKYLILPLLHNLLSNRTCLVITGRESAKEDMILWLREILRNYGKIESLWRVRELDIHDPECEVGILGFNDLYNPDIIRANEKFLGDVGFVIMLEPSLIVNTAQIGLSILADYMARDGLVPVYCFLDRITDGLVDSLSHVLQINITEVEAPPVCRNIHTAMTWDADGDFLREKLFDKQTRYMGNGIELAAVAIKNQIPQVDWYSETKVPVKDIKWIAGQCFAGICKFMNLPIQQESINERMNFISGLWGTEKEDYKFIIAEDEFMNMFNTMRVYLSRGEEQTFINVFSENYLLRDYMRCNTQMFVSNPDVIPSIVPDYAKTIRNTLIKMLLLMTTREVSEAEILREFALVGVVNDDANSIMSSFLKTYMGVDVDILKVRVEKKELADSFFSEENVYSISRESFHRYFSKSLQNALFICEEENEVRYVDARLFGHVTQSVLPGQFMVYEGKYYIVHSISSEAGVILRRASNLYDGREYYRQLRTYTIGEHTEEDVILVRQVMDVELLKYRADFTVETSGYLAMRRNDDLRTARIISFMGDPNADEYSRSYHKKTVLRVKLPDSSPNILFTISMLLSETLKSVFPDAWEYIAVTTRIPEDVDGMLNHLLYDISGDVEDGYLYIFEDSELDLGLLEAIEKNLIKFMEIITDYLMWHMEKMREPASKDAPVVTPEFPQMDYKRRSRVRDLLKRIGLIFGVKKEEVEIPENVVASNAASTEATGTNTDASTVSTDATDAPKAEERDASFVIEDDTTKAEQKAEEADAQDTAFTNVVPTAVAAAKAEAKTPAKTYVPTQQDLLERKENPEIASIDGTDIFDETGTDEDNDFLEECFVERGIVSPQKSRYQEECYLKFGFNQIDRRLQLQEVMKYLTVRGFSQNAYRKARTRNPMEESLLDLSAVNHCDFCGKPVNAVSYERLTDGRIRCNDCANSAVNTVEEFRDIFKQCLSLMQSFYGINFNGELSVVTADANVIAKHAGSIYKPSTEYANRVLGFAKKESGRFSVYVENGSPRLATILTVAHELTHIWQYKNWKTKDIRKLYRKPIERDLVYEGMAVWASIQYLYLIGEISYARDQELIMESSGDVYGEGFKMFREKYPLIKDSALVQHSPFVLFPPI
ncbi:MAG: hypothetical protein K5682_00995 [Lachnospiraceae bacterium]|nr:hypothetical protein [Lachnospiraceae bacterium]